MYQYWSMRPALYKLPPSSVIALESAPNTLREVIVTKMAAMINIGMNQHANLRWFLFKRLSLTS